MAYSFNPSIATNGLQFLADAGNLKSYPGSGTSWKDLSGNANHTTLVNSPTFTSPYFVFDRTATVARVSSSIFNRTNGTEISIVVWFYPQYNTGNYQMLAANRLDMATYNWMLYQHTTDGALSFHGSSQYKTTYIPTLNVWQQVIITVDTSGNSLMYVNGVLVRTTTGYTYGTGTSSSYLGIGAEPYLDEFFGGRISQVGIYNRVLSSFEAIQNYNATKGRYGL